MMFGSNKKLEKLESDKKELEGEVETLRESVRKAKEDLADTKHKKKMEDEDIKHMVKMSKEANEITLEKKTIELERDKHEAIAMVKDDYRDKMEERLQTEVDNIKEMYGQILERLPNVNARLKGDM